MENSFFLERFREAVAQRKELLASFAAVRLVDGIGDQIPDLYIDRFGSCAVAHLHVEDDPYDYREQLRALPDWGELGIETVFFRQRYRKSAQSAEASAEILRGRWKGQGLIEEHGIRYVIDPQRHINAGFFIDMREVRARILASSRGKKVLNLFCYTGSLGLSALVGGATEVVQVDISKGILNWVKENSALNQGQTGAMRVIPEDSLVLMEREARRIENGAVHYDLVIIDPPSFSRSAQGTFQIERDIDSLIDRALSLLGPAGELILTTNYSSFSSEFVAERLEEGVRHARQQVRSCSLITAPQDFSSCQGDSIAVRGAHIALR